MSTSVSDSEDCTIIFDSKHDPVENGKCFMIGDLLWAKIGKSPFWPCMVSYDPYKGIYYMQAKNKKGEEYRYHVQYFGKEVQHGWTQPGQIFQFQGEKSFNKRKEELINATTVISLKKKIISKFKIPAAYEQLLKIAIEEAESALPFERVKRFETFVFKYESKHSASNGVGFLEKNTNEVAVPEKKARLKESYLSNPKDGLVCKFCENGSAEIICVDCFQSFHMQCIGLLFEPELFRCFLCERGLHQCIACHETGGTLRKCSECPQYFHRICLNDYDCGRIDSNKCPSHACLTCFVSNSRNLAYKISNPSLASKCISCPNVFHSRESCIPVGSKKLSASFIKCPDHYVGKQKVSPQPSINLSYCFNCFEGGELLCCDACPKAYHPHCLNIDVPSGDFFCQDCSKRKYLYPGMIVWAKTGAYRWWPAEIVADDELPSNIKNLRQHDGEFPVLFFGTNEYFWTHRGRVLPYADYHPPPLVNKSSSLSVTFKLGVSEAAQAYRVYEIFLTEKKCSNKPDVYKRLRVNKAVPPAQILVDFKSTFSCSCDPNGPSPCSDDSCLNRSIMVECHADVCKAKDRCENQKFQKRQYASVKLIKTKGRGWGLISCGQIKKGSFVIEYVGEVITHEEYQRRVELMSENNIQNFYFLYLDSRRMIDAGPKGNLARFINHSCDPNCEMVKWSVNGDARIGIFAMTDIKSGEELTFHYHSDGIEFTQKCLCGASNCQGFIGKSPKNGNGRNSLNGNGRSPKNGKKKQKKSD